MIKLIAPLRDSDSYGFGHFGASRGTRKHNGVDHACIPNSQILSPVKGKVTKLGYPYSDDLSFRYVQITTKEGYHVRVFYIEPSVSEGDQVNEDDIIGTSQELGKRYPAITEHIHLEVKGANGKFINPEDIGL